MDKKEVNYFQLEDIERINTALENVDYKWRMLIHMMLVTGARRGEILGLKWDKVDFGKKQIYICNSVLYVPCRGVYEDTPKTANSIRYITLPAETISELKAYQLEQRKSF